MADKKRGANEPEPRPIIVKKIIVDGHGGHHGGAWKVAYADFVTAMMAFFLLMWLLGATTEKQRKALADYFTPTLVELKMASAGSTGLLGGDSLTGKENYPTTGGQGNLSITIPRDATGTKDQGGKAMRAADRQKFESIKKSLEERMMRKGLGKLRKNVRFTETREGLRIDLIDEADFAMFAMGTDRLLPEARTLVSEVATVLQTMPNALIVRGHTDALPYAAGRTMNNWRLSSARAEATRQALADTGIGNDRFARIEGVADREPFMKADAYDPRNRRMSIILGWSRGGNDAGDEEMDAATKAAIKERDDPMRVAREQATKLDMGGTGLPAGAALINPSAPGTSSKPGKH
ncbi:MAG TPA: flagellar motor protein MotB [Sphingobium sp.]|uniref:flagellar motor protein MotB n=1 Tax=unclassified Sphingobium TaxID=2611147 RepID=UPI000ED6AF4D|nr:MULTISPECIES: flagellar motor protein MotB [unclassified Sphingobium]WIW87673.1 flagellar motor protein MotB [Sphingobium sp. V4]HAF41815.1 flagellar motor protein MotB [Sphingobium sp.]